MDTLSQILWRERELLETLAFKLEVEHMVLASGRTRWLVNATREIEGVLEDLRATEVLRASAADEAAERFGLTPNPSLGALADAAPDPWRGIMRDHRDAMIATTCHAPSGVALRTIESADLARTSLELELQEIVHQAALGATSRVMQPSLLDFLR